MGSQAKGEGITDRWNTAIWETVDQAKCEKYIGHLQKVIPKVIELYCYRRFSNRILGSYYFYTSYYYYNLYDLTVLAIVIIMA